MKRTPRVETTKFDENIKRYVKNIRYHEDQIRSALIGTTQVSSTLEFVKIQEIISNRRQRIARLRSKLRKAEQERAELEPLSLANSHRRGA